MKYYKDTETGEVYAYEADGSQDEFIKHGLELMTQEEIHAHLNPPAPTYVPQQVTNAQGAAALIQAGLWQPILDYVEGMQDTTEKALAEVALHRTTHWMRTSPFLNNAASELGLSSEDLDNLFIQASEIEL